MIRLITLAGLTALVASPTFAAGATCSSAAASAFQPKATLESQLKADGMTIKQIKTEKGCYEVYAIDKAGKKVNVAYNAETLAKVDNPEAGEQ